MATSECAVLCLVTQSCPTLCIPMDCSPSGSSAMGMLQARIVQWIVMLSSRGSSQPRDRTWVSHTERPILYHLIPLDTAAFTEMLKFPTHLHLLKLKNFGPLIMIQRHHYSLSISQTCLEYLYLGASHSHRNQGFKIILLSGMENLQSLTLDYLALILCLLFFLLTVCHFESHFYLNTFCILIQIYFQYSFKCSCSYTTLCSHLISED